MSADSEAVRIRDDLGLVLATTRLSSARRRRASCRSRAGRIYLAMLRCTCRTCWRKEAARGRQVSGAACNNRARAKLVDAEVESLLAQRRTGAAPPLPLSSAAAATSRGAASRNAERPCFSGRNRFSFCGQRRRAPRPTRPRSTSLCASPAPTRPKTSSTCSSRSRARVTTRRCASPRLLRSTTSCASTSTCRAFSTRPSTTPSPSCTSPQLHHARQEAPQAHHLRGCLPRRCGDLVVHLGGGRHVARDKHGRCQPHVDA